MMKRLLPLAPVVLLAVLGCSKIEDTTGLGGDLIGSVDPRVHAQYNIGYIPAAVLAGSSTREKAATHESGPLHDNYNRMVVGKWGTDSSIGRAKFDSIVKIGNSVIPYNQDPFGFDSTVNYTINRVRICFPAAKINPVFPDTAAFQVLIDTTLYDSIQRITERPDLSRAVLIGTVHMVPHFIGATNLPDTGYYPDTTLVLDTAWYTGVPRRGVSVRRDTLAIKFKGSAFNVMLVPLNYARVLTLEAPRFVVDYSYNISGTADSARTDSLFTPYTDFSVFESNPDSLNQLAISAYPSYRRAVFTLDLTRFWESLYDAETGDTFLSIQSARAILPPFTYTADTTISNNDEDSVDIEFFLTSDWPPDTTAKAYFGRLPAAPAAGDSSAIFLNIREGLINLMLNGKSPTAYLTLAAVPRPVGAVREKWGSVDWGIHTGDTLPVFATFSFPR